jgi:prevent-host-death family protein
VLEWIVIEHTFVDNPNHKGNVAELAIATEAARLGLSVLKPLTEHERYDLVIGVRGGLLRVQCKWASRRGEVILVRLGSSYHSPTRGYVKSTYDESEVDAIAVYCADLAKSYLLPIDVFAGRSSVHLRVGRARNNQRAALNWARDYEFPGAVAQLEERCHGMAEVRGSSPLSSTSDVVDVSTTSSDSDLADLKATVGMDEFYAKLAHYVRRAEAGDQIAVTRWGRAVACLGPAKLKSPALAADE